MLIAQMVMISKDLVCANLNHLSISAFRLFFTPPNFHPNPNSAAEYCTPGTIRIYSSPNIWRTSADLPKPGIRLSPDRSKRISGVAAGY